MNTAPKNIKDFPTLPGMAFKIIQLALEPDVSLQKLANAIMGDVALAGRILKVVNSPYYGLSRQVSSVPEAVVLLGLNMVKNAALSLSVMDAFKNSLDQNSYGFLLNRSLNSAVAAEAIAEASSLIPRDEAFLVGLFADLGLFMVALSEPELFGNCREEAEQRGVDIATAIEESLRLNHTRLGLELAAHWSLPGHIRTAIEFHRRPDEAIAAGVDSQAFHNVVIAHLGCLASEIYTDWGKTLRIGLFKKGFQQYLQKSEAEAEELLEGLAGRLDKAAASFNIAIPPPRTYTHILEDANAELGKINIRYEQMYRQLMAQTTELNRKNEELSALTRQLDDKNRQLQALATQDGLTGLYNHRYFQEILARQFSQARRYGNGLALVMLDIDHFKSFNDNYGHQFGDAVLKELAVLLTRTVRESDVVARYGGEEFAIVLVQTDLAGACKAAEKVRIAVEKHSLRREPGQDVRFTISLGVASLTVETRDAGVLIQRADQQLYRAKRNGRNRVCSEDGDTS